MNNNYVLGLDIGITSVGYGVIDIENGEFVDYGVRLFEEGTPAENKKRRDSRSRRRLTARRHNRIHDMQKLLKGNGIMLDSYHPFQNIYELQCKGLTKELTKDELTAVILNITKHRGSVIETVEEDASKSEDELSLKATLQQNEQLLKNGKFVCQIQLDRLNNKNSVRGHENNFSTKDYLRELEVILQHQDLNDDLINKILDIVGRRRAYYEGPGSEKSPTPYGRFVEVDGQIQYFDMIEKMRGKCSVFPEELRAPKMSIRADLFNILNDFNNLSVNGNKLTVEEKERLLKIISKKGKISLGELAKELDVDKNSIKGFRVDKKDKPIFTEFKGYKKIKSILEKEKPISLEDCEMIDSVIEILTNKKGIQERKEALQHLEYHFSNAVVETLANTTGITGYHSLSFKALRLLNKELFESEMNQMQLLHELKLFDKNRVSYKGKKRIEANSDAILSPVAKRAQNETFKVVNALRKKYGEFDSIVVEMTRDKNSKEKQKRIKAFQSMREEGSQNMNKMLEEWGYDPSEVNGKTRMKIRLYEQQNGKSAYTLQPLDLNRVIKDPSYTEIDHIIPISISLDDSQNNKVLALRSENQMKGNLTPFLAYSSNKFQGMGCSYSEYKTNVLSNKNIPYRKRLNLLNEEDIIKEDIAKKFINRNLVDTSYACRVVLNTLSNYFKDNEIDTKVHTINGRVTDIFRKKIHLEKQRDEDYLHHAIDALIVASIKKMNLLNGYLAKQDHDFNDLYNEETGEIRTIPGDKVFFDAKYIQYIINLKTIYQESSQYYNHVIDKEAMNFNPIKISYKIDTKPNRQLFDEQIKGVRTFDNKKYVIEKISDIYNPKENTKLIEDILNNNCEKYFINKNDPRTFEVIKNIVKEDYEIYQSNKEIYKVQNGKIKYVNKYEKDVDTKKVKIENPLKKFYEENGAITKFSNKKMGPPVKSLKYKGKLLKEHAEAIDHTQNRTIGVKLKLKPYRTDFYKCKDGKVRFVTIRYMDVEYKKNDNMYHINQETYEELLTRKKIDSHAIFLFSLHTNELLMIERDEGTNFYFNPNKVSSLKYDGKNFELFMFLGTNNDSMNRIEVKPRYKFTKDRINPITTTFLQCKKMATDVLGNLYEVKDNKLKLDFK